MKTIRQRAKEYSNYTICKGNEEAFAAGATTVIEELKMVLSVSEDKYLRANLEKMIKYLEGKNEMKVNYQWHNAPKELPDRDCVCVTYYNGGYHINVWNNYYKVWDDEEGDDSQFEASKELDWMVLEVEDKQ